jgi:hypothetical protein
MGRYEVGLDEIPLASSPLAPGLLDADAAALVASAAHTVGWHLALAGATRVISAPVPGHDPFVRFWAGFADAGPATDAERRVVSANPAPARR